MKGLFQPIFLLGLLNLACFAASAQTIIILEPNVNETPNTLRVAGNMLFGMYIDRIIESDNQNDTVFIDIYFEPCPAPGLFVTYDTTLTLESTFPYNLCVTNYLDTLELSSPCIGYNDDIDTAAIECLSIDQILNTLERVVPQLDIYPVPTRDQIQLSAKVNANTPYRIFDLKGQAIAQGFIHPDNTMISVSDFPDGLYVLELNLDGVPIRKKFVKSF